MDSPKGGEILISIVVVLVALLLWEAFLRAPVYKVLGKTPPA